MSDSASPTFRINGRLVGRDQPAYIIAEMSANHARRFEQAVEIIRAASKAGADAIKLQTYTPDTMTIDSVKKPFRIEGTLWEGRALYDLYADAQTPWDWHPKLKQIANEHGLDLFSTPFDETSVRFLQNLDVPAFKIASFENVDLPLLRHVARTGKPVIMSTGMATLDEIDEAVMTLREAGATEICLLKCTSAYPAPPSEMNLRTIPDMSRRYGVPVGLSDHSLDLAVPVAAVAVGACVIEKHFTLSRRDGGPDSAFSVEPTEFRGMVDAVRTAEAALGNVSYGLSEAESATRVLRRSLFVVADVKAGEKFTSDNIRSIRPGNGLHTRHLEEVIGKAAARDIERGTPLTWPLVTRTET